MFGDVICKGCRTYIPVSESCALGVTDIDDCPCPVCLVKGMCNTLCDELNELLLNESAKRLRDKIDDDIARYLTEEARRDNGKYRV